MLRGKTVLITSGGTLEKWDNVRGHTNLSKGAMGCYLAEAALQAGANVIYMHGYFTKLPEHASDMRLVRFEGIVDLGDTLKGILQTEQVDVVIMAVAGSDWIIDKVFDQSGNELTEKGKMPSDEPPVIHFKKAPKILAEIKKWAPETTLVGFKLEATEDIDFLVDRAKLRMEASDAQFMVANSSKSLYGAAEPHYIVSRSGDIIQVDGKQAAAQILIKVLN
ncbi:phosphopantothenoylcysteine decarboxylase domain-containing protein [Solibacillus sp. FSL H8-0538]|uniref:phosphopantothenoylcysteine decarboxylase domain-containing protein n=1 Tax=Solibacillus sp. FSL H8-0538 TaxID=2921400 RepID=UPI0030F6BA1E